MSFFEEEIVGRRVQRADATLLFVTVKQLSYGRHQDEISVKMKKEVLLHYKRFVIILISIALVFTTLSVHFWHIYKVKIYSTLNCNCAREITHQRVNNAICDNYASFRAKGQKIVSYSFYGNSSDISIKNRYLSQIHERAKEVQNLYPNWIMRIYYDLEQNDILAHEELCELWCQNEHVDLCDVTNLPLIGNLKTIQPIGKYYCFCLK